MDLASGLGQTRQVCKTRPVSLGKPLLPGRQLSIQIVQQPEQSPLQTRACTASNGIAPRT
jgi:hypothetical protein